MDIQNGNLLFLVPWQANILQEHVFIVPKRFGTELAITGATNLLPRGGTYTAVARPKDAWMANM